MKMYSYHPGVCQQCKRMKNNTMITLYLHTDVEQLLRNLCCDVSVPAEMVDSLGHLEDTTVNCLHGKDERRLMIAHNL